MTAPLEHLDESFERAMCIVAHPDDIEYGAAAAVDRWTKAGKTVTYLLATRGEAGIDTIAPEEAGPLRAQEERDGALEVGVDVVTFLDYDDGTLEATIALRRDIAREIRIRRPELIVIGPHDEVFMGDRLNQADHRACGEATLDAVRDAGNRWVHRELTEQEGLEPWGGCRAVFSVAHSEPTHYVDVTGHLEAAIASLEAHALYNAALPDDFPKPPELLQGILGGGAEQVGDPAVTHALVGRLYSL